MVEILVLFEEDTTDIATRIAWSAAERGYHVWGDPRQLRFASEEEFQAVSGATRACVLILSPQMAQDIARRHGAYRAIAPEKTLLAFPGESLNAPLHLQDCQTYFPGPEGVEDPEFGRLVSDLGALAGAPLQPSEKPIHRLRDAEEQAAGWRAIRDLKGAEAYHHYLHRFGENGLFSSLARKRIACAAPQPSENGWDRRAAALAGVNSQRRSQKLLWSSVGAATAAGVFVAVSALAPVEGASSLKRKAGSLSNDARHERVVKDLTTKLNSVQLALQTMKNQRDQARLSSARQLEEKEALKEQLESVQEHSLKLKAALARTPSPRRNNLGGPAEGQGAAAQADARGEQTAPLNQESPAQIERKPQLEPTSPSGSHSAPIQAAMIPVGFSQTSEETSAPTSALDEAESSLLPAAPTPVELSGRKTDAAPAPVPSSAPTEQKVSHSALPKSASPKREGAENDGFELGALEEADFPEKAAMLVDNAMAESVLEDPPKEAAPFENASAEDALSAQPVSLDTSEPISPPAQHARSEQARPIIKLPVKRERSRTERRSVCDPLVKPC